MFTDETELLGNAEKSDDDGDEPRLDEVGLRQPHGAVPIPRRTLADELQRRFAIGQ